MPQVADLSVDQTRLWDELATLATYSDTPAPSVTRILFTETDMQGRAYVRQLMSEAGLTVIEDAIGNIIGRWEGEAPEAPRIGSGSHCDAIPHAGAYDGTVGVLGGIAAVRALREIGFTPKRSIDIIMFTSEEPTRFGIGCSGSRLLGGALSPEDFDHLTDDEGKSFNEVRIQAGYDGELATVPLDRDAYHAFIELHVEQGPILEREKIDIGVVSAIAAPASFEMTFEGDGGHAGTVLMPDRKDALIPAAMLAAEAETLARNSDSDDTVATVGMLEVHPSAINSIPRTVKLSFDIRDTDTETRDSIVTALQSKAKALAEERGLGFSLKTINSDPPAIADNKIINTIETACDGVTSRRMVSRAYHDSLFMANVAPMGMIFVPSKDGISHRPEEYTSPEEIANGVAVLAKTLATLSVD